jgi:predicted DNA-binding transcriptional regulator YafY
MSRTARLLELLIKVQAAQRFTVEEMAGRFGVSRRTMLRDLHTLSAMGVPLTATPGPGGGYALLQRRRLLPLALTLEEALGILLSYESFVHYAQAPFGGQALPTLTKLRNALPPDILRDLERLGRYVVVLERQSVHAAPLLGELLRAALDGIHAQISYEAMSGASERLIYPFGLFASAGFWYCACYDYKRAQHLSLRVDRITTLARVEGLERPPMVELARWFEMVERDETGGLRLQARVSARGMKHFDLQRLFGKMASDEQGGGTIDAAIPASEIEWYAAQLLPVGSEITIISPPELIAALRRKAQEIVAHYAGK